MNFVIFAMSSFLAKQTHPNLKFKGEKKEKWLKRSVGK
jgi:hypothetical protein